MVCGVGDKTAAVSRELLNEMLMSRWDVVRAFSR
jgi:hypothetical protein